MAWGRLDDGFDEHAKTLALLEHERGVEAIGLWTLCLAYAHRSRRKGKTAGHLPAGLLRRYVGRDGAELAALLVEVNYWEPSPEGGWLIVNFAEYLPTEKTSEARSIAGRKGAEKRWGKTPDADSSEPSPDGNLPSVGHEGDGNAVANDGSRADAGARSHPHSQEQKKTSSSSLAADAAFDQFWAAYPRKESKGAARAAWTKALKKTDAHTLVAAALEYRQRRNGQEPQFTKQATTWLNQECWTDETPAPSALPAVMRTNGFNPNDEKRAMLERAMARAQAKEASGQ